MIDGLREDIYNGTLQNSNLLWLNTLMKDVCAEFHCKLINLNDVFLEDYLINKRQFNSDFDGHWDQYGHQVVSQALLNGLEQFGIFTREPCNSLE